MREGVERKGRKRRMVQILTSCPKASPSEAAGVTCTTKPKTPLLPPYSFLWVKNNVICRLDAVTVLRVPEYSS